MSELDKNPLEIAILSILSQISMSSRDIVLELNQQGSSITEIPINTALARLTQVNYISQDPSMPSKYVISNNGREALGNLLAFLLNHVNSITWDNLEPIREGLINSADLSRGDTVLDCSSGIGDWFSKQLSREVGPKGQVIFLSQDPRYNLEYYEKLIVQQPEYSNISFVIKSEFVGKIESNSIDAVFQVFGLHFWENVGVIMQDLGRILKPGGKIVICDPLEIDHFIFNQFRRKYSKLHTGTTPENMRNILLQAGFQNIKVNSNDGLCIASAEKIIQVVSRPPLERLITPEDKEKKEKEKHYYKL